MSLPKRELKRRYDLTAESYDKRYAEIQRRKLEVVLSRLPSKLGRVLDLGCGTGGALPKLEERCELVVGVDFSEGMLREAREKNPKAILVQADTDHLPLQGQIFDAVISITLLQNLPRPLKTLQEVARVLKPKGLAVITSLKQKHSSKQLEELMLKASLKPLKAEEIKGSEDVICMAVKKSVKTALVVVDMINDFVRGKLKLDQASNIIPRLQRLLDLARSKGIPVVYVCDSHRSQDPELKLWGEHALEGSEGSQIIPELKPQEGDRVVRKRSYSAFYATELHELLQGLGVNELWLVGVSTDVCIQHTAADAFFRGYEVVVVKDCVEAFTPEAHQRALEQMQRIYGARIVESTDLMRG